MFYWAHMFAGEEIFIKLTNLWKKRLASIKYKLKETLFAFQGILLSKNLKNEWRKIKNITKINKYVCINACLNLPQRHNLAWQPCDDSWARAVFKMACSILGLLSPWYQTTAKRTTWVSRVNILRVYSLRFT